MQPYVMEETMGGAGLFPATHIFLWISWRRERSGQAGLAAFAAIPQRGAGFGIDGAVLDGGAVHGLGDQFQARFVHALGQQDVAERPGPPGKGVQHGTQRRISRP